MAAKVGVFRSSASILNWLASGPSIVQLCLTPIWLCSATTSLYCIRTIYTCVSGYLVYFGCFVKLIIWLLVLWQLYCRCRYGVGLFRQISIGITSSYELFDFILQVLVSLTLIRERPVWLSWSYSFTRLAPHSSVRHVEDTLGLTLG